MFITRYSPERLKAPGVEPLITTQTFATREEAEEHGLNKMGIKKELLIINPIKYSGDDWRTFGYD